MKLLILRILDLAINKDSSSYFWSFVGSVAIELFMLWASSNGTRIPFYAHLVIIALAIWMWRDLMKESKKLDEFYKEVE